MYSTPIYIPISTIESDSDHLYVTAFSVDTNLSLRQMNKRNELDSPRSKEKYIYIFNVFSIVLPACF